MYPIYFDSKRGSYYGAKYFLEKYLRRLNEDTPPCPLCHRLFESQDEVEELISEVHFSIIFKFIFLLELSHFVLQKVINKNLFLWAIELKSVSAQLLITNVCVFV